MELVSLLKSVKSVTTTKNNFYIWMYGFPVRLLSIQNEQTVQDIVISYQIFYYWHAVVNLFSYHLLPTK